MASKRQIHVGGVADRRRRARRGADDDQDRDREPGRHDGADPHGRRRRRGHRAGGGAARAGRRGAEARSWRESPIPVIADIHFNHTLALKAIEAGAHCVRLNPGNIGGPEKVAEVIALAKQHGTPLRVGVNSGSLPKHLRQLEYDNPVEALVTAAIETVELMERLDFTNFKVSMKSTSVPNTIASNRLLSERIPYPLHLGVTEAGTKWSGSLKSAVGPRHAARGRDRRHDPDLAVDLPRRGRGEGRLGDPQGAEAARAGPRADRLPHLRAAAVRHGHGRGRRGRAPPGSLRGPDRGVGARLRRQRHRRGPPRRLRHHRAPRTWG